MIWQTCERFYNGVSLVAHGGEFSVNLDNQRLCTPAGRPLIVPSRSLAEAIAAEWRMQGSRIRPTTMPLTQLTNTAIDRMSTLKQEGVGTLLALAATDLVCYRAIGPPALVELQQAKWQPLLDGMRQRYGVHLRITAGVMPIQQSKRAFSTLHAILSGMENLHLAALYRTSTLCNSLVIAFSLLDGLINTDMAFYATELDQLFQGVKWGIDSTTLKSNNILYYELQNLVHFTLLLAPEQPERKQP